MKSSFIILAVTFLLISMRSLGQTQNRKNSNSGPVITKGYYSIGNNSERLNTGTLIRTDSVSTPAITKGYYSIESNNAKLSKKQRWSNQPVKRPVSKKGYYSIGTNE